MDAAIWMRIARIFVCFNEADRAPGRERLFPSIMAESISFVPALVNTEPLPELKLIISVRAQRPPLRRDSSTRLSIS